MAEYDTALEGVLEDTQRLIIKQEVEVFEATVQAAANAVNLDALGAFGETANKYDIFTDDGGKKFRVIETSDYCGCTGRVCCRPNHALKLHVYLPEIDREHGVMHMDRPCKCGQCCACMDCCRQEMRVYEGEGHAESEEDPSKMIGYIQQPVGGGMFSPQLNVMNREGGEPIAVIQAKAVCYIGGMCCDHTFTIKDPVSGRKMGKIVKERPTGLSQIAKELATDADNFTMYVNKDMHPKTKGTMLAALHLIDYMFFEDEGDGNLDLVNHANASAVICTALGVSALSTAIVTAVEVAAVPLIVTIEVTKYCTVCNSGVGPATFNGIMHGCVYCTVVALDYCSSLQARTCGQIRKEAGSPN